MKGPVLLDTGPIVAILDRRDRYHEWAKARFAAIKSPLLTCEPVMTEACYLVQSLPGGVQAVMEMLLRGFVEVGLHLSDEARPIERLLSKYSSLPISLADACLVRMSEIYPDTAVFTLDSHFRIYRRHGRQAIRIIFPDH